MRIAFATYNQLPELASDDQMVLGPLATLGIETDGVTWDDPQVDWSRYDAVVLRSTWDYHKRVAEFYAWLDHLKNCGVRLINDDTVVRWNTDKTYLSTLNGAGVPFIPTIWGDENTKLSTVFEQTGWKDIIVKPKFGATAYGAWTIERGDPIPERSLADHLIQPIMPQIRNGEFSLVFFSGVYSHTIHKQAANDTIFVQVEHGGTETFASSEATTVQQARRVLEVAANHLHVKVSEFVYARVDGLMVDGQFVLMELELVEPSLGLHLTPTAPAQFAKAIATALKTRQT
jgi:glutathione synthase/RimK-type ligase-like ATP-grasp enzyme